MVERREFRRHRVGGNVEFTSVHGSGSVPGERATVLDCSLGGARLRVRSPRRRLFKAVPPCLAPHDSVTCVLRLAPDYQDIEIFAEVVRVARREDEPDDLDVGLRFFHDVARRSHAERPMARLARIIEPDWSAEERAAALLAAESRSSGRATDDEAAPAPAEPARASRRAPVADADAADAPRAPERSGRLGQRLSRQGEALPTPDPRKSQRAARAASQRLERPAAEPRATSQRLERPAAASQRLERPAASQRVRRAVSDRIDATPAAAPGCEERASRRLRREPEAPARVSGRLVGVRHEAAAPPRPVAESDSEVVAWASSRLTAAAPAAERVATADDEVTVRGSARLTGGEAVIELPGAFTARAREAGLTAHVTPTADCAGLYVAERSPARLVVRELGGGRGAATFDYLVVAIRRA
ncbi:MAG: PilZ domain-containing protein [Planctomycetes bacterium]|nr:PilZ domain-containing protein [Planctomycetota bacterium]